MIGLNLNKKIYSVYSSRHADVLRVRREDDSKGTTLEYTFYMTLYAMSRCLMD